MSHCRTTNVYHVGFRMLRVRTSFTGKYWQFIAFTHVELQCHELRKINALGYSIFRCYPDLGVLHWKGVVRFGKKEKLAPRFVRPFEIIEKVGPVAYRLDLPEELNGVHDTFHVSNLKKCLADLTLQVPLD
ncbi:hypothetical protein Tco_0160458, partial [Tanacetum coccineum]